MEAEIPDDVASSIFAKIARGQIPVQAVYEDDFVIAFPDISPVAPTHILVIPKVAIRDITCISQLSPFEAAGFLIGIANTAAACGLTEDGFRTVMNTGVEGGQTVPYLHAHVLGGRQLSWPPG
jgi:histidine triad (HIT) family protein